MPRSQFISPSILSEQGEIAFPSVPINAYRSTAREELSRIGEKGLKGIYRTMVLIREFETALADLREKGNYFGLTHPYYGPVHLCIGEEAAAAGQAYALQKDDFIFGSHRSHGELIAKGLRFIELSDAEELEKIMAAEPLIFDAVRKNCVSQGKERAELFLLFGAMSEIFAKSTGFQRGFGGSMHVFFSPFGVYPNNAIVGASAPIAAGAALYKKLHAKEDSIAVANIGDGALGCGVVWEAMNFAAMDQYNELWDKKGGLPVLFNIIDNGYGMGGQTDGETMAYGAPARVGAGISPTALHAERVNGNNPLAVYDATVRKRKLLVQGKGPALLDIVTYRMKGHSQSDAMQYREQQEIDAWKAYDPLIIYKKDLIESGIADARFFDSAEKEARDTIYKVCSMVFDADIAPYEKNAQSYLHQIMFSDSRKKDKEDKELPSKEHNSRYVQIAAKKRFGLDDKGRKLPESETLTVKDAVFEAIFEKFYKDKTMISYGEDVRDWGGVCSVYKGLAETLPYSRLFNSPISEAAIVSTAVGYAMCGGRAVIEIMFADFMARAADEIFNQLAKWQSLSAGKLSLPVVVRVSVGTRYGTQHSQDWSALAAHVPGLKVVYPATPYDCKGLMNAALAGNDPVLFFESQKLYGEGEYFRKVPEDYYEVPIGVSEVKKSGTDITIISLGSALYPIMEAAAILESQGISAEIVDARTLAPFDYETAMKSLQKTGRFAVVTMACKTGSVAETVMAELVSKCFSCLLCAPIVIGAPDTVVPPVEYEKSFFPCAEGIAARIAEMLRK
jgi:2-oxoisovalerate dehydrogenase E1 component